MKRTIIIRRDYLHYIPKYNRFEKRHSTLSAHCSPAFLIGEGDKVVVGQCRYVFIVFYYLFIIIFSIVCICFLYLFGGVVVCLFYFLFFASLLCLSAVYLHIIVCLRASPLSKTVRFNVIKIESTASKGGKKQFGGL
jgi:ribosomal protein S17